MTALYGMPSLREIRDTLLFAHNDNLISEEECLLLYDINKSRNLKLPGICAMTSLTLIF